MQAVGILVANGKAPKRRKKGGEENEEKNPCCFVPVRAVFSVRGGGNGGRRPVLARGTHFCGRVLGNVLFSQSSAVAGNCVVSLKMNGDVYVYDAATEDYSLLCGVPVVPQGTDVPYEQLDAVTRSLAGEAVYQLIGSADSDIVYGYCPISGKIGALTETGIAWRDVALDNSVQMNRGWAYPYDLLYPYVEDETLYAYYDIAQDQEEYDGTASPQGRLLMFDLQTGACEVRELADTYAFCRYEEGTLLLQKERAILCALPAMRWIRAK